MEQKPTTIKEIAKQLNISFSTVSRALHNHPNIGLRTKLRVQQLAKELNYEPNQTAIFFQQRKTFTIGVIIPELAEAFFSTSINGIEDTAEKNKYTVLLGQSHDSEEREKKILETMKQHRVDGVIISISKNTVNYEHFESLKKYGIPVVFFDRIPKMSDIHYVSSNMISGTLQAVSFLIKKGHRVIGMINGPEKLLASQERKEGYQQSMTKSRLKFDPSLVVNSDLSLTGTQLAMEELLSSKRKPTAIVTFNDYVALDAIQYAQKRKRKINKDVCFVSFANLPISSYSAYPPLASVEQYPYIQGQKATEILLELMNKNKDESGQNEVYYKIIVESQLVLHEKK
ncbi:MAG: LacI family transcriptional regulator [Ferruginibacter sp.]|uniref:LacI family DNA-binding transcriptional regulator n=1 Tax=Ferruginibacter sp. TaxID=1940288 RepID=UPI0026587889|nr:LacI family DNA-binding transcriptional regulator [Ferruginibacter sp.]MDB5279219.1 LacI family transcriptional regulator [Ferruginibacter sp.]